MLTMSPLNKRDWERFGIDELSKSLDIKILDLTSIIRPRALDNFLIRNDTKIFKNCIVVKNFFQFFCAVINFKPLFYIDYLGITFKCSFIRIFLQSLGVLRIVIDNSLLPLSNKIKRNRICHILKLLDINVLHHMFHLLIDCYFAKARLGVVSGAKYSKKISNAKEKLFLHSFDYQKSLELNSKFTYPKKKYAVFIHQDHEFDGIRRDFDNLYYSDLSLFLKQIESTLKINVLIALHPRHRSLIFDFFDKKKCFSGKTAELIKQSSLVIDQFSAARQYAVIYKKPILTLIPRHIEKNSKIYQSIIQGSQELGSNIIHLNSNFSIHKKNIFQINKKLYKKYMQNYIKTEASLNISLWKGIINWIEQYE